MSGDWLTRLDGIATGDKERSCPEAAKITGGDEFEQHERRGGALRNCELANAAAARWTKQCPLLLESDIQPRAFDFNRNELPIELTPKRNFYSTDNSYVWWNRSLLLLWPGMKPDRSKPHRAPPQDWLCAGGWIDNYAGFSMTTIDMRLAPSEAKVLKDKITGAKAPTLQVAALLDGNSRAESLACDAATPKSATGAVLAWRLVALAGKEILHDWSTVRAWEPPKSCDEARAFFGMVEEEAHAQPGEQGASSPSVVPDQQADTHAAQKLLERWLRSQNAQDFNLYSTLYAPDFLGIKRRRDDRNEYDLTGWLNDRRGMFAKAFTVTADGATIQENADGTTIVRFVQVWSSANYADRGNKELVLKASADGMLIVREEQLDSQVLSSN